MQQDLIEKLEQIGLRKVDFVGPYSGDLLLEKNFIERRLLDNSFIRINIGIVEMRDYHNQFYHYIYIEVLHGNLSLKKKQELERIFFSMIRQQRKLTIQRDLFLDNRLIAKKDLVDFEKNFDEHLKIIINLMSKSRDIMKSMVRYRENRKITL